MSATWDQSQFDRTLDEYIAASSRTVPYILNKKAYFIARKAIWYTQKADTGQIASSLGQIVRVPRLTKSGKRYTRRFIELAQARDYPAPLAGIIINKRRKAHNERGLKGGKLMKKAILDMINARNRSIAFLKSGWLPAVKLLSRYKDMVQGPSTSEAPINDARQYGILKGDAMIAQPGSEPVVTIINHAIAKRDRKDALTLYGSRGLQRAFDDETANMREYIDAHMKSDAEKFNSQQR